MIQSVTRALDLLEYLAEHSALPSPLGQIAEALSLNPATCANLLKTLVLRGYVEQVGPKQGYRLGPMSHFLGRQGAYAADLIAAAEPALAALARELHEHLVISVLRQDRLFMVAEAEGDQVLQVRRDLMLVDDAYRTANGRLLLAFLDESELQGFLRLKGLPGAHWPQAEDEPRLRHQLQAIREQGHYADVRDGELARLAFPIRQRGRVVAALGLYAPEFRFRGKQKELCSRRLPQTADAISQALA